jgi:hypothetical protein
METKLIQEIKTQFPNAEKGGVFFLKQTVILEEKYGFARENTRFAESGCCDEANEAEYQLLETYWGRRFKFGGLAGYCHGGKTALGAVLHHVPESNGQKNLLLVAGAHIGYHDGQWGQVPRTGQSGLTTSCGSLSAIVGAGYEAIRNKPADELDGQQRTVEQIVLPYLKQCADAGETPDIVVATKYLMQHIDADLKKIGTYLKSDFTGQIGLITGITINTVQGNFFSPTRIEVVDRS